MNSKRDAADNKNESPHEMEPATAHQTPHTNGIPASEQHPAEKKGKDGWDKANIIVVGIATVVIALATIATVCVTIHHAKIFSRQLTALEGQLAVMERDQRPWVSVSRITNLQDVDSDKPRFIMEFGLKNSGRSPAFVMVEAGLVFSTKVDWDQGSVWKAKWSGQQKSVCAKGRPESTKSTWAIFPNEPMPYHDDVLHESGIDIATAEKNGGEYIVTVVGCVFYRTSNAQIEPYQTPFVANIYGTEGLLKIHTGVIPASRIIIKEIWSLATLAELRAKNINSAALPCRAQR